MHAHTHTHTHPDRHTHTHSEPFPGGGTLLGSTPTQPALEGVGEAEGITTDPVERVTAAAKSLHPTSNAEEAEVEWFYEDLHDLLELTHEKDGLFIMGDWNAQVSRTVGRHFTTREVHSHLTN